MARTKKNVLQQVVETFSLEALPRSVDLNELAVKFGVVSVEMDTISSEAMLIPSADGYKIILKKTDSRSGLTRQRFSFAHELGHLLLKSVGYSGNSSSGAKHREKHGYNEEERLCDQIAAEILMPSVAFTSDAAESEWSLSKLSHLAGMYGTSIPATARRMVGLIPEPCVMGIWKPAASDTEAHSLQQSFGTQSIYGVPNATRLSRLRLWLIARAANSRRVESGILPLLARNRPSASPPDVPADAWAWGKDEFRRVMVFYYPERKLTDDMLTIANATWRSM